MIDGAVIVGTDAEKSATTFAWSLRPLPPVWPALRPGTALPRKWRHGGSTPRPQKKSRFARADLVLRNDADLASLEAAAAALCEQLQAEGARKGGATLRFEKF